MKKIFFKLLLLPVFLLAGFFVSTNAAVAADIIIDHDTTWGEGDVVVVNVDHNKGEEGINIESGATLTINGGAIVKMGLNSMIIVDGGLIIKGEPNNPVIITSLKDDSAGGDSNNDGGATYPAPGDWWGILVSGPADQLRNQNVTIDYVTIKYGGGYLGNDIGVIGVFAAQKFQISHSNIINNEGWIRTNTANFQINNSNIYNPDFCQDIEGTEFCGTTIANWSGQEINLENNYWGHAEGPSVFPPDLKGTVIMGPADYEPFLTEEWKLEPTSPDPVILIPGMLGSWYNIFSNRWELDPIFHTYDNLWEALKAAGYKEGETLFAFPYQWRNSNASSSIELKNKIDEVKDICKCGKVDIVAHSMGGLVARSYAEGDNYGHDIDQLIFLATPQRGASKAYLMWEGGEAGPDYKDQILKRLFSLEAEFSGYGSVYLYISKLPMKSVQELLPTYDYLRDKSTMALRVYPNNYPRNLFLEDLNNPVKLSKLNGLKITNIIADAGASSTINNFRVVENRGIDGEWEYGYPEKFNSIFGDHGIEKGFGDITVPQRSNKDFNNLPNVIISSDHGGVVTDAQKTVIKELTGTEPANEIRNNIFKKFLMIRIFSPADFRITAPDGKLLGKDFTTNQPINQIQGAFYSGFDNGIEFAVIPDPIEGDYKIDLMGTGTGQYKLSASYIDDNNGLDKEFTGNIEPNQPRTLDFVLAPSADEPISDLITIDGIIKEIESMYAKGWINNMGAKMSLINGLKLIKREQDIFNRQISSINNLINQTQNNQSLKQKIKEKILEQLNKRLQQVKELGRKAISRSLDLWLDKLSQIKRQGKINQGGFNILSEDINNLKINL